jgi:hypothetical protein
VSLAGRTEGGWRWATLAVLCVTLLLISLDTTTLTAVVVGLAALVVAVLLPNRPQGAPPEAGEPRLPVVAAGVMSTG